MGWLDYLLFLLPSWFFERLFTVSTILIVSLAVANHGLRVYYRQKEYELVKQRYLEGAVDILASDVELALGVLVRNVARCVYLVHELKTAPTTLDPDKMTAGFERVPGETFHVFEHCSEPTGGGLS